MDKTERARLLDTLRKRRSRKREKALSEGKPEDFYLTEEDFIDFYEENEQNAASAPGRTVIPSASARTYTLRQKQAPAPEPADEQEPEESGGGFGVLIAGGLILAAVLFGIPWWIARNME